MQDIVSPGDCVGRYKRSDLGWSIMTWARSWTRRQSPYLRVAENSRAVNCNI